VIGDGPTLNDPSRATDGPAYFQTFPVLNTSRSSMNPGVVQGTLSSEPNATYRLQFFSNRDDSTRCFDLATAQADFKPETGCATRAGFVSAFQASQGESLVGEIDVITDGNGNASFDVSSNVAVAAGSILTATATRIQTMPDGALQPLYTSEFSQAIKVSAK
jgi:hypothetical protein